MRFLMLQAHWRKVAVLAVLVCGGVAWNADPRVRQQAQRCLKSVQAWSGPVDVSVQSDEVFWCPMHPQIKSD